MFAITARFSEQDMPLPTNGKMWEAGRNYQESAKNILSELGLGSDGFILILPNS